MIEVYQQKTANKVWIYSYCRCDLCNKLIKWESNKLSNHATITTIEKSMRQKGWYFGKITMCPKCFKIYLKGKGKSK